MKVGEEYLYFQKKQRIIMFDSNEVFYDEIAIDNSLKYTKGKTVTYSRVSRDFFDKNAILISTSVSEKELLIHQPHLPLRLNCFKNIFWTNEYFKTINEFRNYLISKDINLKDLENLNCNKVVIIPIGQQISFKKSIILESSNNLFEGLELLYHCFNIQYKYININKPYFSRFRSAAQENNLNKLSGIGIYRAGIKSNIPSYYLGGSVSLLEFESKRFN
jgi:hypothetical protein